MAKRRNYSAAFKTKLALEAMAGEATIAEHLGNRSSGKLSLRKPQVHGPLQNSDHE